MIAHFEKREYQGNERIWVGRYKNLHNISHWHLENELIFIEKGNALISHNQTPYHLSQGDGIFLSSGEVHYIKSEPDSIIAIFMFDPQLIKGVSKSYLLSCPKLKNCYPLKEIFDQIQTEIKEHQPFYEIKAHHLIASLMVDIFRKEIVVPNKSTKENASIEKYKYLLNEIDEKYAYITFEDSATYMNLSKPYFSRFFKKISGMTFSQYLNIVKSEKAIQLLHQPDNHLSITEIASYCGFDTLRHFNRTFKEITGMSPRQLPSDYSLNIQPKKGSKDVFNPTLKMSELL